MNYYCIFLTFKCYHKWTVQKSLKNICTEFHHFQQFGTINLFVFKVQHSPYNFHWFSISPSLRNRTVYANVRARWKLKNFVPETKPKKKKNKPHAYFLPFLWSIVFYHRLIYDFILSRIPFIFHAFVFFFCSLFQDPDTEQVCNSRKKDWG